MKKYYLTTAIPYVNGLPHIGHSLEYFQADTIKRYFKLQGYETLLLSGADENALKNVAAAEKENIPVKEFLDRNSKIWEDTYKLLGVNLDIFQRGSDQKKHWPGVQKLWQLCDKAGDIYKKEYEGFYCVGCESFKTKVELINELCPIHQTKPDSVKEENYFFKLSKYQDKLIKLIESGELVIIPENKKQETLSFIKSGLEDFSISRSNARAKGVGVPVPSDENQKIYVWFDALAIYLTGIGYGTDDENFNKWWPADLHIIGKDINRFHTIYWPAMLLSAGLPLPKQILIHGFVNLKGEKISKSVGNVISPEVIVEKYGLEAVRYFMLSQIPIDADGDFSDERFKEVYNADLANGLGNLVARVAKLCETNSVTASEAAPTIPGLTETGGYHEHIVRFEFNLALEEIWREIKTLDVQLNIDKPWTLNEEKAVPLLKNYTRQIKNIAFALQIFLPETSAKILKQFSGKIKSGQLLFPRL